MSLLMRFPTRRGRKAEGLSTPTMRRPASSLAGLLPSQGRRDQFSPTGVDQHYGSVSTALTSTAPTPLHPAEIVGMPQFRPGMQRRFGADVSTMDTDTPQSLGTILCPTVKPPHVAGVRSGATSRFTVTPDRLHCTARASGAMARRSGVLHGGRGFEQCAQPTASSSRPSGSGSPGRGRRPNALP